MIGGMTWQPGATPSWAVLLPAKDLAVAKSRLAPLGDQARRRLALAMALDTAAAALRCPEVGEVVAVTSDPEAATALSRLGARVVPDAPDSGLNPALEYAAGQVLPRADGSRPGLVALSGDLPAATSEELSAVLAVAREYPRSFVADRSGTGTTLLAAREGPLGATFGPGSAQAHAAAGAVRVPPHIAGALAWDADTPDELAALSLRGVGRWTLEALDALTLRQGTVADFDPASRSGRMVTDEGAAISFDGEAFDAGGLRLLRVGQRVKAQVSTEGRVRRITLLTLDFPT
jgi:2-phospho-L-lactate guanylyltransferase